MVCLAITGALFTILPNLFSRKPTVENLTIDDDSENRDGTRSTWEKLANKIASSDYERGILFCGTGAGMAIVANKVKGVRAVCINDPYTAERAIASNNAQVVTLGTLITGPEVAKKLVDIWLGNEFQGGGSAKKVDKINNLDQK